MEQTTRFSVAVRQATADEADVVSSILDDAARWLEQRGIAMWHADELSPG